MKKKVLYLFMVIAITAFAFMPYINVYAASIGFVGTGSIATFTQTNTESEIIPSSTNIDTYIEQKKNDFIAALANAEASIDVSKSNVDPNTLFSASEPYKYAVLNNISQAYQMIGGTLTQTYNITYTTYNVTTSDAAGDGNIIRKTTTYYHTIVDGKLTITGDDSYTEDYASGDKENKNEFINGNINDEEVSQKINEYRNDMMQVASDYHETATITGEISSYYFEAHDEITQDQQTGQVTINTILDKYQVYTLTGTAETQKITYTLEDGRGNKISFKDYEGIVYVFNSTDILNMTEEELEAIATEMGTDIEAVRALGTAVLEAATAAAEGKGALIGIYDFSVVDAGVPKTTATGGFKIKIKMTDEMKKYNDFKIAFLKDDGTLDDPIKLTQNGDYLEGTLPHLSTYVIIGNNVETSSETLNPNTGDNIGLNIALLGLSLIGFISIGIYTRKKKYN